ncbi:hypothetical protein H9P43_001946 [Blastocladiella emersonii ATCC 22665]|nr:hypothetical protein H9P43_001946 [Blastocladiella emersonii ATCC 22665]
MAQRVALEDLDDDVARLILDAIALPLGELFNLNARQARPQKPDRASKDEARCALWRIAAAIPSWRAEAMRRLWRELPVHVDITQWPILLDPAATTDLGAPVSVETLKRARYDPRALFNPQLVASDAHARAAEISVPIPDGVMPWSSMTSLRTVYLYDFAITVDALSVLGQLPALDTLLLEYAPVVQKGSRDSEAVPFRFPAASTFSRLRSLAVSGQYVADAFTALSLPRLARASFTSALDFPLLAWPSLQILEIKAREVDRVKLAAGMDAALPQLHTLIVDGQLTVAPEPSSSDGLTSTFAFPSLLALQLSTAKSLDAIASTPTLRKLQVRRGVVSGLARFPALRVLSAATIHVTTLPELATLRNLRSLEVRGMEAPFATSARIVHEVPASQWHRELLTKFARLRTPPAGRPFREVLIDVVPLPAGDVAAVDPDASGLLAAVVAWLAEFGAENEFDEREGPLPVKLRAAGAGVPVEVLDSTAKFLSRKLSDLGVDVEVVVNVEAE